MMKALFIVFLSALPSFASGPLYKHTDTHVDQEFYNAYQDLKSPIIDSGIASTMTIAALFASTMTVSSATITNLRVSGTLTYAGFQSTSAFTNWVSYTPSFTGFGTTTNTEFFWRRVGDTLQIRGVFRTGTVAASEASITIPSGQAIDSAKLPSGTANTAIAGIFWWNSGSAWATANGIGAVFSDPAASTSKLYFTATPGTTGLAKQNGSNIAGSTNAIQIQADVPISGWSF